MHQLRLLKILGLSFVAILALGVLSFQPERAAASHIVAVTAGDAHTCALTDAGGVECWGNNFLGQLGDGTNHSGATPRPAVGLASGVSAVSAGFTHTCALTVAGGVKCWGSSYGSTPVDIAGLASGVAAVDAGSNFTCALLAGGTVQCWGNGGSPSDAGVTSATAISAGFYHFCAVTTGGGVSCWAEGGQQSIFGLSSVIAVEAGWDHTCALTSAGGVKCWAGAVGSPVDVTGLTSGVSAISTGASGYHSCAVTNAGAVKCWGQNSFGQLGDGTLTDSAVPVDVVGQSSGAAGLGAGGGHTCAVTTAGDVACWGWNMFGQLGVDTSGPGDVSGLVGAIIDVSAGGAHSCAVTALGGVKCWGFSSSGQVGDGSTTSRTTPVNVVGLDSGVASVSAGFLHTCALMVDATVKCWGSGFGLTPVNVSGLTDIAAVSAGDFRTCAITLQGSVKCLGGGFGSTPVDVPELGTDVVSMAAGLHGHCAVTETGAVKCWSGPTVDTWLESGATAVAVGANHVCAVLTDGSVLCTLIDEGLASGMATLSAGDSFTCALSTSGAVKCWGEGVLGQLGDGLFTSSDLAVDVNGLDSGIALISSGAGGAHTCALSSAGGVTCWGGNWAGQLGNGATSNSSSPLYVAIDSDTDGCDDGSELSGDPAAGGRRDPIYYWDFMDVPTGSTLERDQSVSVGDIGAIVDRYGSSGDPGGDPLASPAGSGYHTSYDRSGADPNGDPWDLLPPDGNISVGDIGAAVTQFGHSCA